MIITKKIERLKTIYNKINEYKSQNDLDNQTVKISALSSENISKYQFLTGKDVLPEKGLLEKVSTIKRFEYLLLDKELKAQTGIAKKQYQELDKAFISYTLIKMYKSN